MKLMHLIVGLGTGGAERVVLDLSTGCRTITTGVIALSANTEMLPQYKKNNIQVNTLSMGNDFTSLFKAVSNVIIYIDNKAINIIHAHMFHALLIASVSKLFRPKIKIIFTPHNIKLGSAYRKVFVWATKSLRENDILFSRYQESVIYANSVLIPNGIDLMKYGCQQKRMPNKVFRFVAIGRLDQQKNHIALLPAMKGLLNMGYRCELEIIGEGPLRNIIERAITSHKLQCSVRLLGLRSDIPELLLKADCFIMSSLWEGLPIAILEAAASKLPIISTSVGSIPSLLNNDNAYLGQVDKFSEIMIDVIVNYKRARQKAEILYRDIHRGNSLESMCNAHQKLYFEVAKTLY